MSFRTRLFLAILLAVLVPLGALAFGVRRELEKRVTREYESRVTSMTRVIESDLARESGIVGVRLRAMALQLSRDNRFRLAAVQNDPANRSYLLNYAGEAMQLSGLSVLQIQDSSGRIISSGHFRNQFDRPAAELSRVVTARDTLMLLQVLTPDSTVVALSRIDSVLLAGRRFILTGGIDAEGGLLSKLARDPSLTVGLVYPGRRLTPSPEQRVVREVRLPYVDLRNQSAGTVDTARMVLTQSLDALEALRRGVNRWLLLALGLTLAVALAGAAWLSARISRPLRELADKTSRIDLDRLDQSFETDRRDEIGALSRLLGAMTERLRNSSARLRDAERRAAVGDLARQVTHDIKNGLAPIRNVLRHLSQVVKQEPDQLPAIFEARRGTLESSVEYLDTLARNYDRLAPDTERRACDVNAIVEQVLRTTSPDGAKLRSHLRERLPSVLGDGLMVRRVLENLVGNALDSIADKPGGAVTVSTEPVGSGPERVRLVVADTGAGMTRQELDRAFDDFYTTKPGGTGLGLSIVRRLILDLHGSLRVETEPGTGTRVIVELPSAPAGDAAA
jgi:signal transduction histidine kinase